jgi:hypothetical protein
MEKIKDRNTTQSAGEFRKSQSLRLEKQTIRTLTGAELKLAGGGCGCVTCGDHSGSNNTKPL